MKMKKLFLTASAVAAVALCATAQTTVRAIACEDFALTVTEATGTGTLSYQLYKGATAAACTTAIAGCNTQSCTIPAADAINTVVYRRTVVSSECPTEVKETTLTVQYQGLKVGTVCWAPVNVGNTGKWDENPDSYGGFFQFNRVQAWHPTEPAAGVTIPSWTPSIDENSSWNETTNAVCPTGWRLPTKAEFLALDTESDGSGVTTESTNTNGGTWADAGTRGNAIAGRFYGASHATCSFPDNMNGCIFLPAAGQRSNTDGLLTSQGALGSYWSNAPRTATNGHFLGFSSANSIPVYNGDKAIGRSVRCVKTM
jgi:uncharacterized protein (TIGR02145 family)